jgi:hypothetical protein
MFGSSSPNGLGYANSAVMISLIRELVRAQVISPERAENMLSDAVGILKPFEHVTSIKEAIGIIQNGMKPEAAKT